MSTKTLTALGGGIALSIFIIIILGQLHLKIPMTLPFYTFLLYGGAILGIAGVIFILTLVFRAADKLSKRLIK